MSHIHVASHSQSALLSPIAFAMPTYTSPILPSSSLFGVCDRPSSMGLSSHMPPNREQCSTVHKRVKVIASAASALICQRQFAKKSIQHRSDKINKSTHQLFSVPSSQCAPTEHGYLSDDSPVPRVIYSMLVMSESAANTVNGCAAKEVVHIPCSLRGRAPATGIWGC